MYGAQIWYFFLLSFVEIVKRVTPAYQQNYRYV
jgi:hypothetical protein